MKIWSRREKIAAVCLSGLAAYFFGLLYFASGHKSPAQVEVGVLLLVIVFGLTFTVLLVMTKLLYHHRKTR